MHDNLVNDPRLNTATYIAPRTRINQCLDHPTKTSPLVSEAVGTVPHVAISRRTQEPRLKRVKVKEKGMYRIVKIDSRPISIQTNSPIRDDETTYDDGVRPVLDRVDVLIFVNAHQTRSRFKLSVSAGSQKRTIHEPEGRNESRFSSISKK